MLTKVCIIKALVFPVVMYGCESWTVKKVECQRIVAFELCCWRRFLRVPSTARRSNLSILKDINPEYSLEGLILKLELRYFGYLMHTADSLEKDPDAGKYWRQKEKGMTENEMVGWHHQLPEFTQTHVHRDGDTIPPSHPLSSPSNLAFNFSQHQGLFKWVNSSHQVAKVLEFQLQHQSFQWIFRTDLL